MNADSKIVLGLMFVIRKALSAEIDPPINLAVKLNFIPKLVEIFNEISDPLIRFEICWSLTNLAGFNNDYAEIIRNTGIQYKIIELLPTSNNLCKEQFLWALGNIISSDIKTRDAFLSNTLLIQYIKEILKIHEAPPSLISTSCWILSNLSRGKPSPPLDKFMEILPILQELLNTKNENILVETLWIFSYLTDRDKKEMKIVQNFISENYQLLIKCIIAQNIMLQAPSIRILGNLTAGGNPEICLKFFEFGILENFQQILKNANYMNLHKEICWVISNLCANPNKFLNPLFSTNTVSFLVEISIKHPHQSVFFSINLFEKVRKEACWALSNISNTANFEQLEKLIDIGVLYVFSEYLKINDITLQASILLGLNNLFKYGKSKGEPNKVVQKFESYGGLTILENLQMHPNVAIYKTVAELFQKYIPCTEVDPSVIISSPMVH